MRHTLPLEVDRAFLVEALYAACDYFGGLAQQSGDAQIREEYDIKRARCVRLVVNLDVDLAAEARRLQRSSCRTSPLES